MRSSQARNLIRSLAMGMGYVPDDRSVFADLTVDENLEISERKTDGKRRHGTEKGSMISFRP